jgi:chromate reductase, NAD(P)H dehydrogenase (quinone)
VRILGISGSLRRDSYNTALLRYAGELFEAEGAQFELYTGLRDIPPFDEDEEVDAPEAVDGLRAAIAEADGVFFVTPEYNSSVPGALKNALDWVSRPIATNTIRNKPIVVIGASTGGFGAVWAQAELRKVLGAMGARVVDGEVAVGHAMDRFDSLGRLNDPNLEEQVREVVQQLMAEAESVDVAHDGHGGDYRHDATARAGGKHARDSHGHSSPDSVRRKRPRSPRVSSPPTRARRSGAATAG